MLAELITTRWTIAFLEARWCQLLLGRIIVTSPLEIEYRLINDHACSGRSAGIKAAWK
jgi:hypothetical protein